MSPHPRAFSSRGGVVVRSGAAAARLTGRTVEAVSPSTCCCSGRRELTGGTPQDESVFAGDAVGRMESVPRPSLKLDDFLHGKAPRLRVVTEQLRGGNTDPVPARSRLVVTDNHGGEFPWRE